MNFKPIFINDEPRLRAGWRLALQTLLILILTLVIGLPFGILEFFVPGLFASPVIQNLLNTAVITGSVFIARRWLDRRSIASLGIKLNRQAFLDVLIGILITLPMMGLIFTLEWGAGWLTFEGFAWQFDPLNVVLKGTLSVFLMFVLVGWNEELLSRGYHLQTLESGLNTFWAVLLSSAVFGVMHLGNPNSESKWSVAIGILLAGVFLAFGYLRTRQLWLPIGLHIGWNFFEGAAFGFPVSGLDIYRLTRITVDGPEIWTGGPFGPEAGLVLIPGLILGAALIYVYTRGRQGDENNSQEGTDIPDESLLPAA
jgi:membrane protease YdiL (CAAX protease family)